MNNKLIIPALMVSLTLGATTVKAQHHEHEGEMNESKVVEVGNKICPVSGEKVGQMGEVVKVEYNGKIYNLCCVMCKKDFLKDPAKHSKVAEDEVKAKESQMSEEEEMEHDHSGHEHHHE